MNSEFITKEEMDILWKWYREFCLIAGQANMVASAPEFLAYLEKRKDKDHAP